LNSVFYRKDSFPGQLANSMVYKHSSLQGSLYFQLHGEAALKEALNTTAVYS